MSKNIVTNFVGNSESLPDGSVSRINCANRFAVFELEQATIARIGAILYLHSQSFGNCFYFYREAQVPVLGKNFPRFLAGCRKHTRLQVGAVLQKSTIRSLSH